MSVFSCEEFIGKVLDLFRDESPTNTGILLLGAEAIAPGMVTVWCQVDGQFEIYFDPERWQPTDSDLWTEDEIYPPDLVDTGLRVIEFRHSEVHSLASARAIARGILRSVNGDVFYDTPQPIDLE